MPTSVPTHASPLRHSLLHQRKARTYFPFLCHHCPSVTTDAGLVITGQVIIDFDHVSSFHLSQEAPQRSSKEKARRNALKGSCDVSPATTPRGTPPWSHSSHPQCSAEKRKTPACPYLVLGRVGQRGAERRVVASTPQLRVTETSEGQPPPCPSSV